MATTIGRKHLGTTANIRAALVVFAVMFALMAVFLSASLQSRAYDLAPGPFTEPLVAAAERWHQWMEEIGAAGISDRIATEVQSLHDAQFEQ